MPERWLPVISFDGFFEGYYEISNHGQVKSLARTDTLGRPVCERILKQQLGGSSGKRFIVKLNRDGITKTAFVHFLMLEAFVCRRPAGMIACHRDDTTTNMLDNLRWDTYSGNAFDQVRNGNHARARRTHCKRAGHELTPENTYINPTNKARSCRQCMREYPGPTPEQRKARNGQQRRKYQEAYPQKRSRRS